MTTNTAGAASSKDFWEQTWSDLPPLRAYEGPVFEQHPVLQPFLSLERGGRAIEVGCVPGNWLVYLHREYQYTVSGIDYSDRLPYVEANLALNGIQAESLIKDDLFTCAIGASYDLVFSSGFVEHFDNHVLVVEKHAQLARPGGLVVIMVPNLRWIHWCLCRVFNPALLAVHRFPLMRRALLRSTLEQAGLSVLHCEYTKTFRPPYRLPRIFDLLSRVIQKALRTIGSENIPNAFGSPYLISVSRKPLTSPEGRPA